MHMTLDEATQSLWLWHRLVVLDSDLLLLSLAPLDQRRARLLHGRAPLLLGCAFLFTGLDPNILLDHCDIIINARTVDRDGLLVLQDQPLLWGARGPTACLSEQLGRNCGGEVRERGVQD